MICSDTLDMLGIFSDSGGDTSGPNTQYPGAANCCTSSNRPPEPLKLPKTVGFTAEGGCIQAVAELPACYRDGASEPTLAPMAKGAPRVVQHRLGARMQALRAD